MDGIGAPKRDAKIEKIKGKKQRKSSKKGRAGVTPKTHYQASKPKDRPPTRQARDTHQASKPQCTPRPSNPKKVPARAPPKNKKALCGNRRPSNDCLPYENSSKDLSCRKV